MTRAEFRVGTLALTLVPEGTEAGPSEIGVPDVLEALASLHQSVDRSPVAAQTLAGLLQVTSTVPVAQGLIAESLAYSMLMSGAEYLRWLGGRPRREVPRSVEPAVLLERDDDLLTVTLNQPERHNAFSRWVRDELCDAFDLVAADSTITVVDLRGNGISFCSGGDLAEFGSTPDLALAHLIRLDRSVAARLDAVRERVTVHLHGACIGAGIELSSFAGRVAAAPDSVIRLPELAMGLIPGAGGTVGITRRIGPWRTAFLALTGLPLPVPTAVRWGLVDDVAP